MVLGEKVTQESLTIGLTCREDERKEVVEFFQLFKTPWEYRQSDAIYLVELSTDVSSLGSDPCRRNELNGNFFTATIRTVNKKLISDHHTK